MSSSPPSAALDVLADATLVPLTLIDDAPGQPRQQLPDVQDLAANIKAFGLLQPVALRKVGARYQVIAGHRRIAAYTRLRERHPHDPQWSAIQAVVMRSSDESAHLALISAQVHVVGWSDSEVHQVLLKLLSMGMSQADIGRALHRNGAWVSRSIRVHTDPAIAPVVESGELAASVAGEILSLPDASQREQLARAAAKQNWSQRRTRREVRARAAVGTPVDAAEIHDFRNRPPRLGDTRELRRVARQLVTLLRRVKPDEVRGDALADLWALHDQLERLPRPRRRTRAA